MAAVLLSVIAVGVVVVVSASSVLATAPPVT